MIRIVTRSEITEKLVHLVRQEKNVPDDLLQPGTPLADASLVGLGSVCRRQSTTGVGHILTALHDSGITRLHGFGFKVQGLRRFAHLLTSADSMAWSVDARRHGRPLPGCTAHRNCANCMRYALGWRRTVLAAAQAPVQPQLEDAA